MHRGSHHRPPVRCDGGSSAPSRAIREAPTRSLPPAPIYTYWPAVLPLQEAFDVGGDKLFEGDNVLFLTEIVRSGNPIATGVLGDVHAGVGDADDVFYTGAVQRIGRHTETGGELALVEH